MRRIKYFLDLVQSQIGHDRKEVVDSVRESSHSNLIYRTFLFDIKTKKNMFPTFPSIYSDDLAAKEKKYLKC